MIAAIWKNDLRHCLIWLNIIAFSALIIYLIVRSVLSPEARAQRGHDAREPHAVPRRRRPREPPARARAGLGAAVRGDRRGRAAALLAARADPAERSRRTYFDKNAVDRGAIAVRELREPELRRRGLAAVRELPRRRRAGRRRADHAQRRARSAGRCRRSTPWCCASRKTRLRRPVASTARRTICDVTDIITYGRPGTPMQAWGVVGGGPKNDQSIPDLVAYLESIQLTRRQSQDAGDARAGAGALRQCRRRVSRVHDVPGHRARRTRSSRWPTTRGGCDAKRKARQKALNTPTATDADLTAQCNALDRTRPTRPARRSQGDALDRPSRAATLPHARSTTVKDEHGRGRVVDRMEEAPRQRQRRSAAVRAELRALSHRRVGRCSTRRFHPATADGVDILGLSGGGGGIGGGIGFNLRDGDVDPALRRPTRTAASRRRSTS